ncbi:Vps54 domain-containing protein [Artemisia annua]|uniref:Vps54 domain-containing protein n=1 Tax=Artemisia annua TaxID=35608 RepID=A0A2U1LGI2_ARTAN|nr:Vps54 domain-containing protein [Artemisia annua]
MHLRDFQAKLPTVLRIYRDTVTSDMKTAIKSVVAELLPVLARPLDSDLKLNDRNVDADGGGSSLASKLRSLSSESFVQLLGTIFMIVQTIVDSLFSLESLVVDDSDDHPESTANSYNDVVSSSAEQPSQSADGIVDTTGQVNNNRTKNEHGKSSTHLITFRGVGYHMVNCGLILLKMLSEYIDMNTALPALSSEVIHRVLEMLKYFNTRACQLVLGAGAMQVSGLKSITAKHLALASQVVSFVHAILPEIRRILFLKVPDTRKGLLLSEIERVSQDYKVHRDEIHTKLVQIMRERLLLHSRGLPQIIETWNRADETDLQPSQFAKSLTKEVGFLQRVLSKTLHEADVLEIFKEVTIIFDIQISDAFAPVDISIPQARARLNRDLQHILACIRSLPSARLNEPGTPIAGQLESLLQRTAVEADQ